MHGGLLCITFCLYVRTSGKNAQKLIHMCKAIQNKLCGLSHLARSFCKLLILCFPSKVGQVFEKKPHSIKCVIFDNCIEVAVTGRAHCQHQVAFFLLGWLARFSHDKMTENTKLIWCSLIITHRAVVDSLSRQSRFWPLSTHFFPLSTQFLC